MEIVTEKGTCCGFDGASNAGLNLMNIDIIYINVFKIH